VTKHWADTIEREDKVKMLIDPTSAYAQACGMAMRRAIDDLIITAARASVLDGDGNSVALPGGNTLGGAGQQLTYTNILAMQDFFHGNDVDPDDERTWVLSPAAVKVLMEDAKIINSDYQKLNMLVSNGVVSGLFGGRVIMSNRLLSGGTDRTYCMCYTKKAMVLGVNDDMFASIDVRTDLSYATQVYAAWTLAAARVEDNHIVFFDHDETP
jgi:hypothetical protein